MYKEGRYVYTFKSRLENLELELANDVTVKLVNAKGLAEGLAEGEAKKSRETALEMLKDGEPLTKIMKYSKLAKEDILLLAKENGIEAVVA